MNRRMIRTLNIIPERLASIRSVVLAFTAKKQTNKQTLSIIYIDIKISNRPRPIQSTYGCSTDMGVQI